MYFILLSAHIFPLFIKWHIPHHCVCHKIFFPLFFFLMISISQSLSLVLSHTLLFLSLTHIFLFNFDCQKSVSFCTYRCLCVYPGSWMSLISHFLSNSYRGNCKMELVYFVNYLRRNYHVYETHSFLMNFL